MTDRLLIALAGGALAVSSFAVGYQIAGHSQAPRYTAFNVGGGRVIRLDGGSGEVALFDANCMAALSKAPPPKGAKLIGCPGNPWDEFPDASPSE